MSISVKRGGDWVQCAGNGTLYADAPLGTILAYGGAYAPSGWFLCDGTAISRTAYSELFAVIGTSFGAGDGSTTFNLPDMREAVPKGAGLTGKTVGAHLDADGLAVGEFLDDRVQDLTMRSAENAGSSNWKDGFIVRGNTGNTVQYHKFSERLGSESTSLNRLGATTEVKSVGVNYIIKAKMVAVPADFMAKVDEAVKEVNEYSTTETVVGKWVDGRPIYRRVFTATTTSNNQTTTWTIQDLGCVTKMSGTVIIPKSGNVRLFMNIPYYYHDVGDNYYTTYIYVQDNQVRLNLESNFSDYYPAGSELHLILEYIKDLL